MLRAGIGGLAVLLAVIGQPGAASADTAPTTTRPVPNVAYPQRLLSTGASQTVRVVIGWSGIPGSYPIVSYTLQESIDGGSETTVATGPATTYTLTANPGSTYSFQAQATDSNGDTGPFTAGPAFSLSEHQQSFATYQGSWSPRRKLAGSWGGTVAATTSAGASATVTCTCMGIAFVSTVGQSYGTYQLYKDGALVQTRTAFAPLVVTKRVLYQAQWSADGAHTLEVVNEGTPVHPRLDVDGFLILS